MVRSTPYSQTCTKTELALDAEHHTQDTIESHHEVIAIPESSAFTRSAETNKRFLAGLCLHTLRHIYFDLILSAICYVSSFNASTLAIVSTTLLFFSVCKGIYVFLYFSFLSYFLSFFICFIHFFFLSLVSPIVTFMFFPFLPILLVLLVTPSIHLVYMCVGEQCSFGLMISIIETVINFQL